MAWKFSFKHSKCHCYNQFIILTQHEEENPEAVKDDITTLSNISNLSQSVKLKTRANP